MNQYQFHETFRETSHVTLVNILWYDGFVFNMQVQSQLVNYLVGRSSQLYKGVLKILHDQVLSIASYTHHYDMHGCLLSTKNHKPLKSVENLTQQIHFLLDYKDAGYSLVWLDPILHRSTNIIACNISASHLLNSQLSSHGHLARAAFSPCKIVQQLTVLV